jgi:hypothetical protein
MALESGLAIVSVTHPPGIANRVVAARTDRAVAGPRDREKRRAYNRLEPNGYPFTPFSVESYARLGKPAIDLRSKPGEEAKGAGQQFRKAKLMSWTLRELSVGLCRGNFHMYQASLGLLAGVMGGDFRSGAAHPMEELV